MTKREFLNAVIAETTNSELASFAVSELEKLDARNAKRASTPSKTQKENAPLIAKIATLLTSEPKLASELAKEMGLSTQKVTPLVKAVEGVQSVDVKVKGKGTQKGYFLAEQQIMVWWAPQVPPHLNDSLFTSYSFLIRPHFCGRFFYE